ncbi:MAG: hypothetical protein ABIR17_06065 [Pseudolysinimonas sp.]|uniref:hypothetical protein n=1 Tax=Pseudolysinimonas sp. TaxID=2680009 RepID=UPI0032633899
MTADDAKPPASGDDREGTVVVAREPEESTVVVDRDPVESTIVVDRAPVESTVVVDRAPAPAADPAVDPDPDPAADRTVVVARDESTVVVERDSDRTVAVHREPDAPSGDVAAPGNRVTSALPPAIGSGRRRRGMTMPPVAPGFGRGAIDAVGPGAVATYEPRAIPAPPVVPELLPGTAATRVESPALPSVRRRTRTLGAATFAIFGMACVVSIAGLIALAIFVFG